MELPVLGGYGEGLVSLDEDDAVCAVLEMVCLDFVGVCGIEIWNEVVRKADWEAWPKTDYAFDSDVAQLKEELERQKGEPDAKG